MWAWAKAEEPVPSEREWAKELELLSSEWEWAKEMAEDVLEEAADEVLDPGAESSSWRVRVMGLLMAVWSSEVGVKRGRRSW